jgi:hypothetical protein
MSISINLGSYRNQADKTRKENQYREYLRLQSKVNARSEQAFGEKARNTTLGIKPAPPQYKSTEEELQDEIAQRELALKNLREIMPREALQGLRYLPDIGELNLFNTHFADFKTKIAGQNRLTPDYFGQLWERYKEYLASTNFTGISIPLTQTSLRETLRGQSQAILDELENMNELSRRERQQIIHVVENLVQDGNARVIEKLRRAIIEGHIDTVRSFIKGVEPTIQAGFDEMKLRTKNNKELLDLVIEKWTEATGERPTKKMVYQYFGKTSLESIKKDQLVQYLINDVFHDASRLRPDPTPTSPPAPDFLEDLWGTASTPQERPATGRRRLAPPSSPLTGRGLERGISAPPPERYLRFGKLFIHMPSLKQSKLNLKYPSLARVVEFPIVPISKELKTFVRDLVENQRMNLKSYQSLKDSDRKLFNKIARRASLDDHLGIDEEDEDTEERERLVERFEILKGEIGAGNDAPQIKQELKRILARFITDGTVSRSQGTQMLIQLSL